MKNENELSVIIPFKNEGLEIVLTCKAIRETAGNNVDIIVLNDDSDDLFDYEAALKSYNVNYNVSNKRLGCAAGRQYCIEKCVTPYFLLMDGHCRFITKNWLEKSLEVLRNEENCIYCCCCQYFKEEEELQENNFKYVKAYGAFLEYKETGLYNPQWNLIDFSYGRKEVFEVSCILGANYLCSKRWWNHIGGLKGLMLYGRDEAFLSKKSIMAGGKCKCIPYIITAHKDNKSDGKLPYKIDLFEVLFNELVISYITLDEHLSNDFFKVLEKINPSLFPEASRLFAENIETLKHLKLEFDSIKVHSHNKYDEINLNFRNKVFNKYKLIIYNK